MTQYTGAGSQIVLALERTWGAIMQHHPELPDLLIIIGAGVKTRAHGEDGFLYGSHTACKWTSGSSGLDEMMVTLEGMQYAMDDPYAVLDTLIHEGAHAINYVRGVQDVGSAQFHMNEFRLTAEEMGLYFPEPEPHPTLGFSGMALRESTKTLYAPQVQDLEESVLAWIPTLPDKFEHDFKPKRETAILYCECKKPRRLTVPETEFTKGPLICGTCCTEFLPRDDNELALLKQHPDWQHPYKDYIS